jgi:PAX-interacting protein 1
MVFPFAFYLEQHPIVCPPEVQNQGLFLPILLSTDQSQACQQLVSQNMQNCMASNGVQSYAGLQVALPPVSGVTQTIPNTVVQNPNMQSIPGVSQNSVGNSMGQGIPSTMFANSQRQMPGNALFGSFMCHCFPLWH